MFVQTSVTSVCSRRWLDTHFEKKHTRQNEHLPPKIGVGNNNNNNNHNNNNNNNNSNNNNSYQTPPEKIFGTPKPTIQTASPQVFGCLGLNHHLDLSWMFKGVQGKHTFFLQDPCGPGEWSAKKCFNKKWQSTLPMGCMWVVYDLHGPGWFF